MFENIKSFCFGNIKVVSSAPDAVPVRFSFADSEVEFLQINEGVSSIMRESYATPLKHRLHYSGDNLSCRLEMGLKIPFGSEPQIHRNVEMCGNSAMIDFNIGLNGGDRFDYLEIDPLLISGVWQRLEITGLSGTERIIDLEKQPKNKVFFDDILPFWHLKLFNADNQSLTVATGDDLWRWQEAQAAGVGSEFKIAQASEGIEVGRKVLIMDETEEFTRTIQMRRRRFKWLFALDCPRDAACEREKLLIDPFALDLTDSSYAFRDGKTDKKTLCFHSSSLQKRLRRQIRALAADSVSREIILLLPAGVICDNASHLDRKNKKLLPHHDLMARTAFKLWADKQLQKSDSVLTISTGGE